MKLSALLTTAVALTVVNARAVETRDDNDKMEKMNNTKEMDGNNADIYPAPMANGGKSWGDAYKKASDIVGQMTVEEKTAIITSAPGRCVGTTQAVERLGIPRLCMMSAMVVSSGENSNLIYLGMAQQVRVQSKVSLNQLVVKQLLQLGIEISFTSALRIWWVCTSTSTTHLIFRTGSGVL